MSVQAQRTCDIKGTSKDAARYRVSLEKLSDQEQGKLFLDGEGPDEKEWSRFLSIALDLCPAALKRLEKFIRRGVTKPKQGD